MAKTYETYHSCGWTVDGAVTCDPCLHRKTKGFASNKPATKVVTESSYAESLERYLLAGIDSRNTVAA